MVCGAPEFAAWVLSSMSSGVFGIDARGDVALINDGARRILGLQGQGADQTLGRDCREVLRAHPSVMRLLLDALSGREGLSRAELVLEGSAGGPDATIGFTLCPVRDGEGRPAGATM